MKSSLRAVGRRRTEPSQAAKRRCAPPRPACSAPATDGHTRSPAPARILCVMRGASDHPPGCFEDELRRIACRATSRNRSPTGLWLVGAELALEQVRDAGEPSTWLSPRSGACAAAASSAAAWHRIAATRLTLTRSPSSARRAGGARWRAIPASVFVDWIRSCRRALTRARGSACDTPRRRSHSWKLRAAAHHRNRILAAAVSNHRDRSVTASRSTLPR